MKNNKVLPIVIAVVGLLIFLSVAIRLVSMKSIDKEPDLEYIADYIQSVLDVQYKSSDNQNWKTQLWNSEGKYLAEYLGANDLSEKEEIKFASFYESLYKKASFEIGEVKKAEEAKGEYAAAITVYPLSVMPDINQAAADYLQQFNERNQNGEFADLSEQEYSQAYTEGLLKVLEEVFNQVEYMEEESIELRIKTNSEGILEIDNEDLNHIYQIMFPR